MSEAHSLNQALAFVHALPIQKAALVVRCRRIGAVVNFDLEQAVRGDLVVFISFVDSHVHRVAHSVGPPRVFILAERPRGFCMPQVDDVP